MKHTSVERFWNKVDRRGPDDCWLWVGSRQKKQGYGRLGRAGRVLKAHRVSWEIGNGPIPAGLNVLHRCDNPPCCNPAHLFLGTQVDNMVDCVAKGRHYSRVRPQAVARGERHGMHTKPECVARGDRHGRAKLRSWQIPYIRSLAQAGIHPEDIARAYSVHCATIERVLSGKTWANAEG